MAKPAPTQLTYEDFLLFPDDGKRHELIDGEHFVIPAPSMRHQRILGELYYLIRKHLEDHPVGEVFLSPLDLGERRSPRFASIPGREPLSRRERCP